MLIEEQMQLVERRSCDLPVRFLIQIAQGHRVCKQLIELCGHFQPHRFLQVRMEGIRIHPAWKWMLLGPADQSQALWDYQNRRGIQQTIRSLISKHKTRPSSDTLTLQELCSRLSAIKPELFRQVRIVATSTRG